MRENGNHSDCLQSVWGGDGLFFRRNYLHDNRCQGFFINDQPAAVAEDRRSQNNLMLRNAAPCDPPGSQCGPPLIVQIFGPTRGIKLARNTIWTPENDSPVALREGPVRQGRGRRQRDLPRLERLERRLPALRRARQPRLPLGRHAAAPGPEVAAQLPSRLPSTRPPTTTALERGAGRRLGPGRPALRALNPGPSGRKVLRRFARWSDMSAPTAAPPATPDPPSPRRTRRTCARSTPTPAWRWRWRRWRWPPTSGIQALLYLSSFGIDGPHRRLLRRLRPLHQLRRLQPEHPGHLGAAAGRRPAAPRHRASSALALLAIAIPVALATIPLAGPLAGLLAPGLGDAGRGVAESALPILGLAMVLQLWAAGGATLLAVRDRFDRIAFAYIAGAVSGLVVYLVVSGAGRRALARLVDAGDGGGHQRRHARRRPHQPRRPASAAPAPRCGLRRLGRCVWLVLGSTAIYLAFNGLYVITLAFASNYGAGGATVLSYAYLFASYLVAGTGFALGMSRIADMRRGALADWREVIADTVPAGFRYSMLIVAPALGRPDRRRRHA